MLTFSKKKKSSLKSMLGFSVMVGAMASILFMNSRPIDVEGVSAKLQQFSDAINADATAAGKIASFTHGAIELKGVGYEKFVVINEPRFTLKGKDNATGDWTVETSNIVVNFDPINDRRFIFKFNEPLIFIRNGQKTVIKHEKPLKFGYLQLEKSGGLPDSQLLVRLPSSVTMETTSEADKSQKLTTTLNFEMMPEILIKSSGLAKTRVLDFEFRNITMEIGVGDKSNIGAVATKFSEKVDTDNVVSGNFVFTVSDFIHQLGEAQARTCSLTTNIDYTTNQSLINIVGLPLEGSVSGKLNKLALSCDDFTMKVDGAFGYSDAFGGAVNISIDNLKAFLASDFFTSQTRGELAAAMPKITGKANEEQGVVTFSVNREKNGTLMLGAVSLEESGIHLDNLFSLAPDKSLPAADAKQGSLDQKIEDSMDRTNDNAPKENPNDAPERMPGGNDL